jgi:hypothetical protein
VVLERIRSAHGKRPILYRKANTPSRSTGTSRICGNRLDGGLRARRRPRACPTQTYSARRASTGSTEAARRAGM